jgi:hypothetical protein
MVISLTNIAVRRQLIAMGCELYDIGVLQRHGRMLLREGRDVSWIEKALAWLKRENAHGAHIFIRPHSKHSLTLLDDLDAIAIAELRESGFGPAAIIETSPGNFQAWVNHGSVLSRVLSTQVAKEMARRFRADPSSADWRHFGRLAGFTNQKPHRRLVNGLAPFVRLREWSGTKSNQTATFLEDLVVKLRKAAELEIHCRNSKVVSTDSIRPIVVFHRNLRYAGDLHRADMAWALYAATHGLSIESICSAILRARDLSKKGRHGRAVDYALRTARKAVAFGRPFDSVQRGSN